MAMSSRLIDRAFDPMDLVEIDPIIVLQVPAHPYRSAHGIDRHAHAPALQILGQFDAGAAIDAEHPMPEDAGRKYGERNER